MGQNNIARSIISAEISVPPFECVQMMLIINLLLGDKILQRGPI